MGNVGKKSYKFLGSRYINIISGFLKEYEKNLIAFAIALAIGLTFVIYEDGFAYKVVIDSRTVGITKDVQDVERFVNDMQKKAIEKYGTNVVINQDIKYERVRVANKNLTDINKIYENIRGLMTFDYKAGVIYVDNKFIAALKSKSDAEKVLDLLKGKYAQGSRRVYFKQDVKIEEKYVPESQVVDLKEALKKLQQPVKSADKYQVKENDSLWSIARAHDMYVDDILKLNPGLTDNLKPGQVINLSVDVPLVTVVAERQVVYNAEIPFDTKLQKDNTMYENQSKLIKDGVPGKKEVTAIVKSYNGIDVLTEIKSEKVLTEPITKVVAVGTKSLPRTVATGSFRYPLRGFITSRYGQRWGRLHTGIDIAASTGSPIYAADGGTVIFSGWESGYGYLVKIDHKNGYVTYYGHASKLLVKVGDKVYKGQKIALVGSTGNTTGPHLHFEVRKDGVPVNPASYLK